MRVPVKCVRSLIRAFVFVVVFGSLLLMMKARHGGREHWLFCEWGTRRWSSVFVETGKAVWSGLSEP